MDATTDSIDMNEKMCDTSDGKPNLHESLTTASKLHIIPDNSIASPTGSLTEAISFSEHISTRDTALSSADSSVNVFPKVIENNLPNAPKGGAARAVSISSPCSVEQSQPKPLCGLLPSSMEACTVCEVSQSFTSVSKSQDSLKTTAVHTEPDEFCAAILLACLFCRPLDCLLAVVSGCNHCVWSLCSYVCGCQPSTLQPLLDITHHCDLCGCLDIRHFLCDCQICDICLQATECLELAMEISQMLYH